MVDREGKRGEREKGRIREMANVGCGMEEERWRGRWRRKGR